MFKTKADFLLYIIKIKIKSLHSLFKVIGEAGVGEHTFKMSQLLKQLNPEISAYK